MDIGSGIIRVVYFENIILVWCRSIRRRVFEIEVYVGVFSC